MLRAPSASHQQLMPKLMKAADLLRYPEIAKKNTRKIKALIKEALGLLEQADDLPTDVRERARGVVADLVSKYDREKGLSVVVRVQCDLNNLIMPQGPGGVQV